MPRFDSRRWSLSYPSVEAGQAVTPEQPTVSAGTSRQATPVRRTYMIPARAARSGTRSRPGCRRHGDREMLAAIVFVATSGCTWQQLPSASFGPSGATAHRRFAERTQARVRAKLHHLVLDELGSPGELDWSHCAIDSVNMRALKRGTWRVRILSAGAGTARRSTGSPSGPVCPCPSGSRGRTFTTRRAGCSAAQAAADAECDGRGGAPCGLGCPQPGSRPAFCGFAVPPCPDRWPPIWRVFPLGSAERGGRRHRRCRPGGPGAGAGR